MQNEVCLKAVSVYTGFILSKTTNRAANPACPRTVAGDTAFRQADCRACVGTRGRVRKGVCGTALAQPALGADTTAAIHVSPDSVLWQPLISVMSNT